jgi:glycine dehydrogenase subunit 1
LSYTPHTAADIQAMLAVIGAESVEQLIADIPSQVRLAGPLAVPPAMSEPELVRKLRELASSNLDVDSTLCFLGAGLYDHFTPAVVDALTSRGEFATAYTPYQPEMSQGVLQAIYEYQSLVGLLTDMPLANASMYDAATGLAEACLMACEIAGRSVVAVSDAVHPRYRLVLETYLRTSDCTLVTVPSQGGLTDPDAVRLAAEAGAACLAFQSPNFFGVVEDSEALIAATKAAGLVSVVAVDPVSLGLLEPPGTFGADIVVGEGQGLGVPMGFGGPLLGFFACRLEHQRRFPGRIVGATVDKEGRRGYTMTLRTREQDIRREKATSNICTNQALMALAATVHLCALGREGLRQVSDLCLQKSHYAADQLCLKARCTPAFDAPFFKEFSIRCPAPPERINEALASQGIIGGYPLGRDYPALGDCMLVCVTETKTRADIDRFVDATRQIVETM